jgi:hypothetical protein
MLAVNDDSVHEEEEEVFKAFQFGYESGSRQRRREEDEISHTSNISAASSLPSVVDSIFTTVSGSSMSSLPGPQGASERFVALLLEDFVIKRACAEALNVFEHERFERNLRRLLKDFATELRKEADTTQQRHAANFVRFRARNSAHMICNSLRAGEKERAPKDVEDEGGGSEDADSDRSEDELENLQQLEHFLKTSRAFEIFRIKLKAFVYPSEKQTEQAKVDIKIDEGKEGSKDVDTRESRPSSNEGSEILGTNDQNPQIMLSARNALMPGFDRVMKPLVGVLRSTRPPLLPGKTRIEWQCVRYDPFCVKTQHSQREQKCGQKIYDDFVELIPGAAEHLKQTLTLMNETTASTSSPRSSTFTSTFSASLKSFGSFFSVSSTNSKNSLPLHERHSSPNSAPHGSPIPQDPNTPPPEPQFLPICYSEGRYATRLLQPELVKLRIDSDQAFFDLLRASYQSTSGKWTSMFSLRILLWIKFVHFELYCNELVDVRKINDIPPPEHVEYRYAPVPPDVIPPSKGPLRSTSLQKVLC